MHKKELKSTKLLHRVLLRETSNRLSTLRPYKVTFLFLVDVQVTHFVPEPMKRSVVPRLFFCTNTHAWAWYGRVHSNYSLPVEHLYFSATWNRHDQRL